MRGRWQILWLSGLLALVGCGSSDYKTIGPDEKAPSFYSSAGDELLAFVPKGAEFVLEIDVERLRNNGAVGEVLTRMAEMEVMGEFSVFKDASVIVVAAFDLGAVQADALTLVRAASAPEGARTLAAGVYAVGSSEVLARLGSENLMASDSEFRSLRDEAVPKGAPGAALRITASLDFEARLELSRRFNLGAVPTALSMWADVVDDFAVVAMLHAEDKEGAMKLKKKFAKARDELATTPLLRRFSLAYLVRSVRMELGDGRVRATLVIPPDRLTRLVSRVSKLLGSGSPEEGDS